MGLALYPLQLGLPGTQDESGKDICPEIGTGFARRSGDHWQKAEGEGTLAYTAVVLIRNDELMIGLHWNGSKCCTILGLGLWHCVIIRTVFACQYC